MNVDLDLAQLRALAAVVDEGSFDAAARRLHVTPSAVSQRVKALETHIGQVLVRRARPCVATGAGQALVRLAREWELLAQDTLQAVGGPAPDGRWPAPGSPSEPRTTLSIAVNADSLSTWFPEVLATLPSSLLFDLHREDQDHSAALLRDGVVMAAVTADPAPVQGCRVRPLGAMRYRAVAARAFAEEWFPDGPDARALARAPMLDFNRKDALQRRFLTMVTGRPLEPPVHRVPSSAAFVALVRAGLGWGMVPEVTVDAERASGDGGPASLVELAADRPLDVPLHWQHWRLASTSLESLTGAVEQVARRALRPLAVLTPQGEAR